MKQLKSTLSLQNFQNSMSNPFTAPGDVLAQRIFRKVDPEFEAETSDLIGKANRRIIRTATGGKFEPALEVERRPDILKESTKAKERDARILRRVRRSSIDG